MRLHITSAALVFAVACANLASAQNVLSPVEGAPQAPMEPQPIRAAIRAVASDPAHFIRQRPPGSPVGLKRCLRRAGIVTAIVGGLAAAALARQDDVRDEDRWRVARLAVLGIGVPIGVVSLTTCGP